MNVHEEFEILRQLLEPFRDAGTVVAIWQELVALVRQLLSACGLLVLVALSLAWLERVSGCWLGKLWYPANTLGEVHSPARTYRLTGELATGDLCEVVLATSGRKEFLLKVPRQAEAGELLAKERELLLELTGPASLAPYRQYLPRLVDSFRSGDCRVNAFAWRDGLLTAEELRLRHPRGVDGRHVAWMFNRTLEVLGYAHQRGWLHGAVLPPHLLFDVANHGLVLVDWIHAERIGQPLRIVSERFLPWYPPECHRREPATPSTDLFLAARSMIYLAAGDPLAGVLPPDIPVEMADFFGRCLHDSPSARSQDAWQLRDEFAELLGRLYGPPQFHALAMH